MWVDIFAVKHDRHFPYVYPFKNVCIPLQGSIDLSDGILIEFPQHRSDLFLSMEDLLKSTI